MVRETSLQAYIGINEDGTAKTKRAQVYLCVQSNVMLTRNEIAARTGIPINTVCGRVKELLDAGAIFESGMTRCTITGRVAHALTTSMVDINSIVTVRRKPSALESAVHKIIRRAVGLTPLFARAGSSDFHIEIPASEMKRLKKLSKYKEVKDG